jgi:hypothetical protein
MIGALAVVAVEQYTTQGVPEVTMLILLPVFVLEVENAVPAMVMEKTEALLAIAVVVMEFAQVAGGQDGRINAGIIGVREKINA